jgi:hypothetical protein
MYSHFALPYIPICYAMYLSIEEKKRRIGEEIGPVKKDSCHSLIESLSIIHDIMYYGRCDILAQRTTHCYLYISFTNGIKSYRINTIFEI